MARAGVYDSVVELIGNTPLLRLKRLPGMDGAVVYAKLEAFNPGGSVKDRIGVGLIEAAEREGKLRPGDTIIEPTAGNTGIGLAIAAVGKPYKVIFVVPEKFSVEKQQLMRALGAEVVNTPTSAGIRGAIEKCFELAAQIPGSFVPQQFANPANPDTHYRTTGPELFEQMEGRIDFFVAGVGTGGTFTGAARFLKEKIPGLRAVAVQPEGSILGGLPAGPYEIEGIGLSFIPETLDTSLVDEVATVSDREAFQMVADLARHEGLLTGSSAAAAAVAAQRVARAHAGARVAVIFPDAAERYLSKRIFRSAESPAGAGGRA